MDTEEILKQRYRYLYTKLQLIKNKIARLNETEKKIQKELSASLQINNKSFAQEELSNISEKTEKILEELSNTVIPIVSSKS